MEDLVDVNSNLGMASEIGNCLHRQADPEHGEEKKSPVATNLIEDDIISKLQGTNLNSNASSPCEADEDAKYLEDTLSTSGTDICENFNDTEENTTKAEASDKTFTVPDTEERPPLRRQNAVCNLREAWEEDDFYTPRSQQPSTEDILSETSAILERTFSSGGGAKRRMTGLRHWIQGNSDGTCGCDPEGVYNKHTGAPKKPSRMLNSTPIIAEEECEAENAGGNGIKMPRPTFMTTPEKEN